MGKLGKLSLAEINEFRVCDLLDYVDIVLGKENDVSRKATQADIDAFYN